MRFQLFRERFSEAVDRPKARFAMVMTVILMVVVGFSLLGYYGGADAKRDFCQSHDCSDSAVDRHGDEVAEGFYAGTILTGIGFLSLLTMLLCCCYVKPEVDQSSDNAPSPC